MFAGIPLQSTQEKLMAQLTVQYTNPKWKIHFPHCIYLTLSLVHHAFQIWFSKEQFGSTEPCSIFSVFLLRLLRSVTALYPDAAPVVTVCYFGVTGKMTLQRLQALCIICVHHSFVAFSDTGLIPL